jgi:hypothetical protein
LGAIGSVEVTGLSAGAHQVAFPMSGLTIIGIISNGTFVQIPIDSSRIAILPNTQNSETAGNVFPMRHVHWTMNGTSLNYTTPDNSVTTVVFYYGSPYADSKPLSSFAAVVASATLSGGAGTATLTFPSGDLNFAGITFIDTTAGHDVTGSWATSSGQLMTLYYPQVMVKNYLDITGLSLTVQQTLSITLAGTGSDVIYVICYYA